jgi:hypothetical protein
VKSVNSYQRGRDQQMPFRPGQVTNPNGARKERKFYQMLLIALNAEGPDIRLRRIAEQLVKAAEKGEAWAIRELMDRIDGFRRRRSYRAMPNSP